MFLVLDSLFCFTDFFSGQKSICDISPVGFSDWLFDRAGSTISQINFHLHLIRIGWISTFINRMDIYINEYFLQREVDLYFKDIILTALYMWYVLLKEQNLIYTRLWIEMLTHWINRGWGIIYKYPDHWLGSQVMAHSFWAFWYQKFFLPIESHKHMSLGLKAEFRTKRFSIQILTFLHLPFTVCHTKTKVSKIRLLCNLTFSIKIIPILS